ncbi:MAG: ribosome maturation factor RimM [Bacteroidota bacterium]
MEIADCFHLGHVAKLHGYKGEVSLFLDVSNPQDYVNLDAVFIDINNQLTPFFVEQFKLKNKGFATVKFEGVDTEQKAKVIVRKSIYLPAEKLTELTGTNFYDHEVEGFTVIDTNFGIVGILDSVMDYAVNPLLSIKCNKKEVLVPLIEGLVKEVDRVNKTMTITAPEGLIEMYLA